MPWNMKAGHGVQVKYNNKTQLYKMKAVVGPLSPW